MQKITSLLLRVRRVLESIHLTKFLWTDGYALLVLAFTRPADWTTVAVLAVLLWFAFIGQGDPMDNPEKENNPEPSPVVTNVDINPQHLADLARQGIGVKITIIELTPAEMAVPNSFHFSDLR